MLSPHQAMLIAAVIDAGGELKISPKAFEQARFSAVELVIDTNFDTYDVTLKVRSKETAE